MVGMLIADAGAIGPHIGTPVARVVGDGTIVATLGSAVTSARRRAFSWRRSWRDAVEAVPELLRGVRRHHFFEEWHWPRVGRGARFLRSRGTVCAGRGVQIGERCWLKVYGRGQPAHLRLGDRVIINNNTTVEVTDRVEIGEGTLVSWNCNIMDSDFHRILDGDGAPLGPISAPVIIGRHVWIGSGCTILKGVTIGDNAVIAAASVVVDDVPANVLVAGNPARVLRPISDWR